MNADVWKNFWNIYEMDYDPTGINNIKTENPSQSETYYTIEGKKVISSQKGIHIVKKCDGTVRKVYVK